MGVEKFFSMSFLIPNFTKKGVKKMQQLKVEKVNDLDLSFLSNDFFIEILSLIIQNKKDNATLACACLEQVNEILACPCLDTSD